MMPVVLLAGFCTIMVLIAMCRLVLAEERQAVDIGTTLLVLAIATFVFIWIAIQLGISTAVLAVLVAVGLLSSYGGIVMLARGW